MLVSYASKAKARESIVFNWAVQNKWCSQYFIPNVKAQLAWISINITCGFPMDRNLGEEGHCGTNPTEIKVATCRQFPIRMANQIYVSNGVKYDLAKMH